jgi:exodeoxyribonuclease V alpha subunit
VHELSGIVDRVIHRNGNGFIIFSLRSSLGSFPVTGTDSDIHEADVVQCQGDWTTYKGEPQFKAKSIIPQIPSTEIAILDYLSSGRIKGISRELASRMVQKFGTKTLEVIEQDPDRLRQVKGFGQARVQAIKDSLQDQVGYRSILVFLHGFGLSKRHITKIYKHYGIKAVEAIKENPYQLCYDVEGVGFTIADRIALRSGFAMDDPRRVMAGIVHTLNTSIYASGDTGMTKDALRKEAFNLLNREGMVDEEIIEEGIGQIAESSLARRIEIDGIPVIFPVSMYQAEVTVANQLQKLVKNFHGMAHRNIDRLINDAEQRLGITLAPQQREAVKTSSSNGFSIVTGGPGTGKTTIIRTLIDCLRSGFGYDEDDILLCAPTGKAAKRLSQSSGMEAMTMHRALSFNPETGGFAHNRENPFKVKVIVIDEGSMVDTQLMGWFIQAVDVNTQLIVLGDVDQLASVGPGKVLKDMIDSECVPYTRLTDIYRQSAESQIILNAHMINQGEMPDFANGGTTDFWFINALDDNVLADQVLSLVARMSTHFGLDPFEDIQILTPMRKGVVGQVALNNRLQAMLNGKAGPGIKLRQDDTEVEFKIGDKVMHIQNNKDLQVFNGDTGRVDTVNLKDRSLKVNFEGRLVEYAFADLEQLRLSYAMTIHKSQGSEYPCVIIVASESHYTMLQRNLYYTGITRGKKYCTMVGSKRAVRIAVSRVSSEKRLTGLMFHIIERV